jgi:8-oxo-dGTP pyrophosphatase MutT (NUDIX family)
VGTPPRAGGGFRRLDERVVHRGHVVTTVTAVFAAPDGHRFERDVIRHPGAVAVVPVGEAGTVTLVRQYRAPVDRWVTEVPAGTRDVDGEDLEETARRELAEEVGLAAERLELVVCALNTPGFCDEETAVYLATGLSPVADGRRGVEEEHLEVVEVTLDAFDDLVDDGTIVDAVTILGVGLARRRLAARTGPDRVG